MKTVFYRYQQLETSSDEGFYYGSMRVTSDTKVTEEMCKQNEFGTYFEKKPDSYIFEIYNIVEDDV